MSKADGPPLTPTKAMDYFSHCYSQTFTKKQPKGTRFVLPCALKMDAVNHDGEGMMEGAWSGWLHFILWAGSREQIVMLAMKLQVTPSPR